MSKIILYERMKHSMVPKRILKEVLVSNEEALKGLTGQIMVRDGIFLPKTLNKMVVLYGVQHAHLGGSKVCGIALCQSAKSTQDLACGLRISQKGFIQGPGPVTGECGFFVASAEVLRDILLGGKTGEKG
jgi:hypothetical protein